MQSILLLDESLQVEVFFSNEDCDFEDNICLKVVESCPEEVKLFKYQESNLFLTRQQASDLAKALLAAVQCSEDSGV